MFGSQPPQLSTFVLYANPQSMVSAWCDVAVCHDDMSVIAAASSKTTYIDMLTFCSELSFLGNPVYTKLSVNEKISLVQLFELLELVINALFLSVCLSVSLTLCFYLCFSLLLSVFLFLWLSLSVSWCLSVPRALSLCVCVSHNSKTTTKPIVTWPEASKAPNLVRHHPQTWVQLKGR